MKHQASQTNLFGTPEVRTVNNYSKPLEKDFMQDVQHYAVSLSLPSIHVETFHQNSFMVQCPVCGNSTLATCRKAVNRHLAGYPDIIGVSWGIETKREGFEPSPLQVSTHEALRRQGVPVITVSPGNVSEAVNFLKTISAKG
jgi:hypothetical protein